MTQENPAPRASKAPPRAAAAGLWTLVVLAALLWPGHGMAPLGEELSLSLPAGSDKVVHAVLFAFEALFVARWLRGRGRLRPLATAVAAAGGLAAATELLQLWVPQRSSDLADLAADLIGIAVYAGSSIARQAWKTAAAPLPDNHASLTGYEP